MHGAYMAPALLHASANSCIHGAGRRNVVIACTSAVDSHLGLDLDDFGCQEPILKLDDVGLPFCCPAVLNRLAALDFSLPFSGGRDPPTGCQDLADRRAPLLLARVCRMYCSQRFVVVEYLCTRARDEAAVLVAGRRHLSVRPD